MCLEGAARAEEKREAGDALRVMERQRSGVVVNLASVQGFRVVYPGSSLYAASKAAVVSIGAINGGVRADFFWGFGDAAGSQAGKMRQAGRMWVLLPRGYPLPNR